MATPYDGKILLVNWKGRITPGNTIADLAQTIRQKMPNVSGVMLKTSNGVSWQGHLNDEGPKAITGPLRIKEWVDTFAEHGLEIHVWGVPRAKRAAGANKSADIAKEADKFVQAATVAGVKSLLLDVEHGEFYWQGDTAEVKDLMQKIRAGVHSDTHIGLIIDPRRNRPFTFWVDPWIPFIDSLHPMEYPIMFGRFQSIEKHMEDAFRNLGSYNRPIVPMLQAFGEFGDRPTPEEITRQGNTAWSMGAAGISYYRLSSDNWSHDKKPHMGEPEYAAIAAVPAQQVVDKESGTVLKAPTYTWQDVINAAVTVSLEANQNWSDWFAAAGAWTVFNNSLREEPYSGLAIGNWPIDSVWREKMLALLGLSSDEIAKVTAVTQNEHERTTKIDIAKTRQKRGSIVGVHGAPGVAAPPQQFWDDWIELLKDMNVKWYKMLDNGDPHDTSPHSTFAWAKRLKKEDIEPIIRYYLGSQFPDTLPEGHFQKMKKYAAEDILWAEIGNEPNLDIEWRSEWRNRQNRNPMRHTNPDVIQKLADTWVRDAKRALDAGVKPAFYAFAPTDWRGNSHPLYSSVFFTKKVVAQLAKTHHAETLDIFKRGGWIAVHAATYEQADEFATERSDSTVWDMTLRSYEVVIRAFKASFGNELDVDIIPVMSTEGGVFTPDSTSMIGHDRLATDEEHARRVVEMFKWLERNSPLQAMCPWCLSVGSRIGHFDSQFQFDGWVEEVNGQLINRPVIEAMKQLRFDQNREDEEQDKTHHIVKLDVPYISQFDATAKSHNADCGPTSLAMIINAGKAAAQQVTVDTLYTRYLPNKEVAAFTLLHEMTTIGQGEGIGLQRQNFTNDTAMNKLHNLVDQGKPFVVLVNYEKLDDVVHWNFKGGHFFVVTGYDEEHVFVHDPLFRGSRRSEGQYFVWRNEKFLSAWGGFDPLVNPNFVAFVPEKTVVKL
jgi:uncharacterized protein YvpB